MLFHLTHRDIIVPKFALFIHIIMVSRQKEVRTVFVETIVHKAIMCCIRIPHAH